MKKALLLIASICLLAGCELADIEERPTRIVAEPSPLVLPVFENNKCEPGENNINSVGFSRFCINEYHMPFVVPHPNDIELFPTIMTLWINDDYDLKFKRQGECDDEGCKGGFDIYIVNKAKDTEDYLYDLSSSGIYNMIIEVDEFEEGLVKVHFFIETLGGSMNTLYFRPQEAEFLLHHIKGYYFDYLDNHYKLDLEFENQGCKDQAESEFKMCDYKTSTIIVNETEVYSLDKDYEFQCEDEGLCLAPFLDAGMPDFENKTVPITSNEIDIEMNFNYETGEFLNLTMN